MKLADGLDVLELPLGPPGSAVLSNLVLLHDNGNAVLIDTGVPGLFKELQNAVESAGVPFNMISKVIITHHDMDHIGNLAHVQKALSGVKVLAHEAEKPYIEFSVKPIKIPQEWYDKNKDQLIASAGGVAKVNTPLKGGEELPDCGGIVIIHSLGHTPGHISVYLKKYKVLVTGDAMNASEGKLFGPNPKYTFDMEMATNSLKKFIEFDIETVVCFHGGICTGNPVQSISEIAGIA